MGVLTSCAVSHGQEAARPSTWDFDSITPKPSGGAIGTASNQAQEINVVVMRSAERWNVHDLEGYLDCFWRSPRLLYVVDAQQITGWGDLAASLRRGYASPSSMGTIEPERIQISVIAPDVGLVLDWWHMRFPGSRVYGTTTMVLRKFSEGWKVVASHTSVMEN